MRIAIILAISVIFTSGMYTAFAEEPIPELIFEGGNYEIYKGNQIIVPIKVQVENHNHQIIPKILTMYEDKVYKTTKLIPSRSGTFQTLLIINDNYKNGEYYIQMDYDGIKINSVPFTISRDHLVIEKEDMRADLSKQTERESVLNISSNEISVGFSYPHLLHVSGVFGDAGSKGLIHLDVIGPISYSSKTGYTNLGTFETKIIVNRDWPSGEYIIRAIGDSVQFASTTFTVNNRHMPDAEIPITGSIELDSRTSNNFEVLLITGSLEGSAVPQTIGIKISKNDHLVDILTTELGVNGDINTNMVLYDYSSKSAFESGKYLVEFVDLSAENNSYSVSTNFIVTDTGKTIVDIFEGAKISELDNQRMITFGEILEDQDQVIHEIELFGHLGEYTQATGGFESKSIVISIIDSNGEKRDYSVYGKSSGEYSMPLYIDRDWQPGKYDVYVTYNDITKNTISFNLGQELELDVETEEEVVEEKIIVSNKLNITFGDDEITKFVSFNFSAPDTIKNNEQLRVILEKPNGLKKYFFFNTIDGQQIEVPLSIQNSWEVGDYTLSFIENSNVTKFGEFTIYGEKPQSDVFILSEHLDTANPEMIYPVLDNFSLEKNQVFSARGDNTYLGVSGGVSNYNSGDIEIEIYKNGEIVSVSTIQPTRNGSFSNTVKIDDKLGSGFVEIRAIYDGREFAVSEFLVANPNIITTQFGSTPIQISRDMFVESGGIITLKLIGPINNYKFADSGIISFTVFKPDTSMETFETEIKKWGYFSQNFPITSDWQNGTYIISAQLGTKSAGHIYLQILDSDMNWVKKMTNDWVNGSISTYQYTNRINTAIQDGTISSDHMEHGMIPEWLRNTASMWMEDKISENEYVGVLKFITNS